MTAPTLTPGDRYLDNCGREWTVDQHGGLEHHAAGGVLRRAWHSLDACAGPLQPVHDKPQPGEQYRDGDGDTWTVLADGRLAWDETTNATHPLTETFSDFAAEYGPITKVETVNEPAPFRPLPLFTDAQRDAIGAAFDRTFPPSDGDDTVPDCPDYYRFPCGAQVIEVSRYLTSNAGQAVQYIARSCRTDGIIKSDPLGDLYKAADMIRDEIERLELAAHRDAA